VIIVTVSQQFVALVVLICLKILANEECAVLGLILCGFHLSFVPYSAECQHLTPNLYASHVPEDLDSNALIQRTIVLLE